MSSFLLSRSPRCPWGWLLVGGWIAWLAVAEWRGVVSSTRAAEQVRVTGGCGGGKVQGRQRRRRQRARQLGLNEGLKERAGDVRPGRKTGHSVETTRRKWVS